MAEIREEKILVLFGSSRGTGEGVAERLVNELPEKLSPEAIRQLTGNDSVNVTIVPELIGLDDWIKEKECCLTRLIIIVVSSYGIGGAPMNARSFRNLCDDIIRRRDEADGDSSKLLKGIYFALLGLGGTTINDGAMSKPHRYRFTS